jgi:hypothetical protein
MDESEQFLLSIEKVGLTDGVFPMNEERIDGR